MSQSSDRAIVTLAIGDSYVANFMRRTRPNWERYCRKYGYDLILLTELIDRTRDPSKKSIHWQKLLIGMIPQLRKYAQLAWLDGDILINERMAPCLFSQVTGGGIGVVDVSGPFHRADDIYNLHTRYLVLNHLGDRKRGATLPEGYDRATITDSAIREYYRFFGFDEPVDRIINTGVLVFSPAAHGDFLGDVYCRYDRDFLDMEQTPLSYELQVSGRAEYIDPRFNAVWSAIAAEHYPFLFNETLTADPKTILRLCVNTAFRNTFFLHFAASANNPIVKGAFDMIDLEADNIVDVTFPEQWARRDDYIEVCPLEGLDRTGRGILF